MRLVADPVRRYLWRRTNTDTADDVLAETLLALWRRREQMPLEAETIAWAIGVARLQLANAQRAQRRRDRLAARVAAIDPPATVTFEPGGPADEDVRATLAGMRAADSEILRLWAWDDLAPRELAAVLGITVNAATVRLHRARRRFEAAWSKTRRVDGHVKASEGNRP
ncbi:MAG: sigma-70 family RNA polymerase sigma factor [Microbacterium enclense]